MKKILLPLAAVAVGVGLIFLLTSCLVSKAPLSAKNECRLPLLEGDWIPLENGKVNPDGAIRIADAGTVYQYTELKQNQKVMTFMLCKIDSNYFVSVPTRDNDREPYKYMIFRLRAEKDALTLYNLNDQALKAVHQQYASQPEDKGIVSAAAPEFRSWCQKHAAEFSVPAQEYRRAAVTPDRR